MTPATTPSGLRLDALRDEDAATLHAWRSDPGIRDGALGYPFPTSVDAEREWIRGFTPRGTPTDLCLALREGSAPALLGYCQLRQIDWVARVAEFGIVIAPGQQGRGLGRSALALCTAMAIGQFGLRRLWLRVAHYNAAAIHLYESAGFRQEGRLPRHAFRDGSYHDVLLFGWEAGESTQ